MSFEIVRNDITNMRVDAIVNTANPKPVIGAGTDARIHQVAGPELLQARRQIGEIAVGDAAVTPAFNLQANYVIHTVGPVWVDGNHEEEALLRSCYDNALHLAAQNGCQSVAFPLISTGNYGFPKDKALEIAICAFTAFLMDWDLQVYLVVFDGESYRLSEKLFHRVAAYIDEHYFDEYALNLCEMASPRETLSLDMPTRRNARMAPCKSISLEDILRQEDVGFTEKLLNLIDQTGKKDSEVYKKANLSKQHFSKIRNNPHYKPTKSTALALAIALELDVAATRDLIGRAGYALTNSSKFDLIIRYFIESKNYNIVEINLALYEFDQPLLGE